MNYEQKYKEALSRARVVNPGTKDYNIVTTIFPELKKSDDERIRENAIQIIRYSMDGTDVTLPLNIYKECINWLEKQGEPINKEPKFKVGDWVVDGCYDQIGQIVEVKQLDDETCGYTLDDGTYFSGYFEEKFHLWTIQDAKDGDVLATKDTVFIFKHMDKAGLSLCKSYCEVIGDSKLGLGFYFPVDSVHPATKEQRDLLFQKMHEAGYRWDSNRKELIGDEQQ